MPNRPTAGWWILSLALLVGCVGGPEHQGPSWKPIPITEVQMVVGEWEGTVKKEHGALLEGGGRLMIRGNNTYLFAGQTSTRAAVGSGPLEVRDGRLIGDTDRRALTLTLYDHKGQEVLVVDATNHETGERYRGEFRRAEGATAKPAP
ncbi:MAG: hypothetical protein P0111_11265 [Nitrospira sp.]|nr:hypothetical protein [Nitrospira sp.]